MKTLLLLAILKVGYAKAVVVRHRPPTFQVTYGMRVVILRGFYKGCVGIAVSEYDDFIVIRDAKCAGNLVVTDITIPGEDLRRAE